jgi:hypothetical protein
MYWKYYVLTCENGRMRHVETVPGMVVGVKENDGRGKFN